MPRKIPIISLEDFEAKAKKPLMVKTLVSNIAEGIDYYINKEEYEECSKVKKLIEKL